MEMKGRKWGRPKGGSGKRINRIKTRPYGRDVAFIHADVCRTNTPIHIFVDRLPVSLATEDGMEKRER